MKKTKLLILLVITVLIIIFPLTTNATTINPDGYKPSEIKAEEVADMYSYIGVIAGAIQIFGTIISIVSLLIIGIRYVASSIDEKAELKERLFPYLIGAVLLFGASNLVNIVYKTFKF